MANIYFRTLFECKAHTCTNTTKNIFNTGIGLLICARLTDQITRKKLTHTHVISKSKKDKGERRISSIQWINVLSFRLIPLYLLACALAFEIIKPISTSLYCSHRLKGSSVWTFQILFCSRKSFHSHRSYSYPKSSFFYLVSKSFAKKKTIVYADLKFLWIFVHFIYDGLVVYTIVSAFLYNLFNV